MVRHWDLDRLPGWQADGGGAQLGDDGGQSPRRPASSPTYDFPLPLAGPIADGPAHEVKPGSGHVTQQFWDNQPP